MLVGLLQEIMERCIANYRKTTGIELRMAIDPDNFLSNELYAILLALRLYAVAVRESGGFISDARACAMKQKQTSENNS